MPATPKVIDGLSILSLRCFVAVVETQSFSSAARQFRLAPSSITKHVQQIEAALGTALVHRTTRRTSVTEAGERFYEECLAILGRIDTVSAEIGAKQSLAGHLRVTAPPSFAAAFLHAGLQDFLLSQPSLTVDVNVTSATEDLIKNRIDVAIALRTEPQSKLAHFRLGTIPLVLCAAPDYLTRSGPLATPADLAAHRCIAGRYSDLAAGWLMGREGLWQTINPAFRLLSDNGELLRQSCMRGAGIGAFYLFHVHDDLRTGRLKRVLPEFELQARSLFAVVPHRSFIRPQARAFIDYLRRLTQDSEGIAVDAASEDPKVRTNARSAIRD